MTAKYTTGSEQGCNTLPIRGSLSKTKFMVHPRCPSIVDVKEECLSAWSLHKNDWCRYFLSSSLHTLANSGYSEESNNIIQQVTLTVKPLHPMTLRGTLWAHYDTWWHILSPHDTLWAVMTPRGSKSLWRDTKWHIGIHTIGHRCECLWMQHCDNDGFVTPF